MCAFKHNGIIVIKKIQGSCVLVHFAAPVMIANVIRIFNLIVINDVVRQHRNYPHRPLCKDWSYKIYGLTLTILHFVSRTREIQLDYRLLPKPYVFKCAATCTIKLKLTSTRGIIINDRWTPKLICLHVKFFFSLKLQIFLILYVLLIRRT